MWGKDDFRDLMWLFQQAQKSKTDVAIQGLVEKAKALQGRNLSEHLRPLAEENLLATVALAQPVDKRTHKRFCYQRGDGAAAPAAPY